MRKNSNFGKTKFKAGMRSQQKYCEQKESEQKEVKQEEYEQEED